MYGRAPDSHTIAGVADRLYFRQLLSGRDFAHDDPVAAQMVNFVYLIGDRQTGEAIAVDPAYGVADLLGILAKDGMRLTGVLATHHHPDHVGGSMMGYSIQGIRDLLETEDVRIHVNSAEAEWVRRGTGVSSSDLVSHDSGDVLDVGGIPIQLLHTPGHTPGSVTFRSREDDLDALFTGDLLFAGSIGRTDLPGGDHATMLKSLARTLTLPDETVVLPGHGQQTTIGAERRGNPYLTGLQPARRGL